MSEKIPRNRISQKDFFNLARFIEGHKNSFTGKSVAVVSALASKEFGFAIAESSIKRAAQAAGVELRGRKDSLPRKDNHDKLKAMARIQLRIIRELGMEDSLADSQLDELRTIAEKD